MQLRREKLRYFFLYLVPYHFFWQSVYCVCPLLQAKQSAAEAASREAEAKSKEAEAKGKEDEQRAAQQELEVALAELKAQEDAYNSRTAELQKASEEGSVVARNKAKNELAQHLGADPLPLRRAKITQEAAVKKAERATKVSECVIDPPPQTFTQCVDVMRREELNAQFVFDHNISFC